MIADLPPASFCDSARIRHSLLVLAGAVPGVSACSLCGSEIRVDRGNPAAESSPGHRSADFDFRAELALPASVVADHGLLAVTTLTLVLLTCSRADWPPPLDRPRPRRAHGGVLQRCAWVPVGVVQAPLRKAAMTTTAAAAASSTSPPAHSAAMSQALARMCLLIADCSLMCSGTRGRRGGFTGAAGAGLAASPCHATSWARACPGGK
jgi:hypothetical protein